MPERPHNDPPTDNLTALGEADRDAALRRSQTLHPRRHHGANATEVARAANVPVHEDRKADDAKASTTINAIMPPISTGRESTR